MQKGKKRKKSKEMEDGDFDERYEGEGEGSLEGSKQIYPDRIFIPVMFGEKLSQKSVIASLYLLHCFFHLLCKNREDVVLFCIHTKRFVSFQQQQEEKKIILDFGMHLLRVQFWIKM